MFTVKAVIITDRSAFTTGLRMTRSTLRSALPADERACA